MSHIILGFRVLGLLLGCACLLACSQAGNEIGRAVFAHAAASATEHVVTSAINEAASGGQGNLHFAHCSGCGTRQGWPTNGLRAHNGRARCRCGHTTILQNY